MSIVVVLDEQADTRELFCSWLVEAKYTVYPASSIVEAQQLVSGRRAHVLLGDMEMVLNHPDGWQPLSNPSTAVVLYTGASAIETAIRALHMNIYDLLLKPVPKAAVLRSVGRAAEHSELLREKLLLEAENRRYQQGLEDLVGLRTRALERRTRQLLMLYQVAQSISALQTATPVHQRIVDAVHAILGYQNAAIFEVNNGQSAVRLHAIAGKAQEAIKPGSEYPLNPMLLSHLVRQREPLVVNDVVSMPHCIICDKISGHSQAIFPVATEEGVGFLLQISEQEQNAFDEVDTTVLRTLTENLGVALSNERLYAQLSEALVLRERIFQMVSHELRTPLTLISGYAEFIMETLEAENHERTPQVSIEGMAKTIIEQTHSLAGLVDQLIAFQRIERTHLVLEPLNVEQWLRSIVAVWRPILGRSGMELHLDIRSVLGEVKADWDYLNQMMQNLLENARKFSLNSGMVTIHAWQNDCNIVVEVQDQGIGVDEDRLSQLFDRFYQVESGFTRRFGGLGLGLALVREIIAKHQGQVWARSEGVGHGLTVGFSLPALPVSV